MQAPQSAGKHTVPKCFEALRSEEELLPHNSNLKKKTKENNPSTNPRPALALASSMREALGECEVV